MKPSNFNWNVRCTKRRHTDQAIRVMKLSVLMPVYNERTVVERCISQVLTAPLPDNMDLELVIVDDCSTDGTFTILERLAAAFSQIRLHRHERNRGKGAAVRTATAGARSSTLHPRNESQIRRPSATRIPKRPIASNLLQEDIQVD